jgi:acyl-ACP thioesterase
MLRLPCVTATKRLEAAVRIRFDECGADGNVRASALLRYAQDLAWAHSEAAGFDRTWYGRHGLTWLVRCLVIEVVGTASSGAGVTLSTEVTGWRRVWARRRSEVVSAEGSAIAVITTDWVLLGSHGGPVRIPAALVEAFPTPLPEFEPARVSLPETPAAARTGTIVVRRHELDPLGHTNHAVYADWLEEAVAAAGGEVAVGAVPRTLRLEFIRPTAAGTTITSAVWAVPDRGWACRLTDPPDAEVLRAEALAGGGLRLTG